MQELGFRVGNGEVCKKVWSPLLKSIYIFAELSRLLFSPMRERKELLNFWTLELFNFLHGLAEKQFTNLQTYKFLIGGPLSPKILFLFQKVAFFRQKNAKNALFLTKNLRNWQKSANFAAANEICTSLCQWAWLVVQVWFARHANHSVIGATVLVSWNFTTSLIHNQNKQRCRFAVSAAAWDYCSLLRRLCACVSAPAKLSVVDVLQRNTRTLESGIGNNVRFFRMCMTTKTKLTKTIINRLA